eukprot:scaffold178325_cov20-Prasinocladus_malaysianus.AAC.1
MYDTDNPFLDYNARARTRTTAQTEILHSYRTVIRQNARQPSGTFVRIATTGTSSASVATLCHASYGSTGCG